VKDYSFIENIWKGFLVKHTAPHVSLLKVNISETNKQILTQLGLPFIGADEGQNFLPFTFLPEVKVQNKEVYLLGDCSPGFIGTSFIGLEKETEEIYSIWSDREQVLNYKFVNQSLHQFLQCLYYYNAFWQKYDDPETVIPEEIKKDYEQLQLDLTQVDAKAMSQRDYFWKHSIEVMEVGGYGDYLTGREIPTDENLRTYTQEEIDNMDLPF